MHKDARLVFESCEKMHDSKMAGGFMQSIQPVLADKCSKYSPSSDRVARGGCAIGDPDQVAGSGFGASGRAYCGVTLAWKAAVEVHMFPFAIDQLPDSSFFGRLGDGRAVGVEHLDQSHVADHGGVVHQSNMGGGHGDLNHGWFEFGAAKEFVGLFWGVVIVQCEIEMMKRQSFDQVPFGFWFKAGQCFIAEFSVGAPVGLHDRIEQLLIEAEEVFDNGVVHGCYVSLGECEG